MATPPISSASPDKRYQLLKATPLDAPFIFDLMMNGSELGAFSDRYMRGAGAAHLFWTIWRGLWSSWLWSGDKTNRPDLRIVYWASSAVGFMNVATAYAPNGDAAKHLSIFAIQSGHRNQGHGTAVLNLFIAAQPAGTAIVVHCTKYAKVMQRILKKLRFRRNPRAGLRVEEYCLVCAPSLSSVG